MYSCYIQSFKSLASFCSWAGWFESYMVEKPPKTRFRVMWLKYATQFCPIARNQGHLEITEKLITDGEFG